MEKIEVNAGESIKIMVNGRVLELMVTGDNSISVNDNPEPERLLTIKEIVDAEAGGFGFYIDMDGVSSSPLSRFGEHCVDAHTQLQAMKIQALAEIMRIADYYNEHYADGWKADWNNLEQEKYIIYSHSVGVDNKSYSLISNNFGLPCFATEELAQLALDNNREVFERFFAV